MLPELGEEDKAGASTEWDGAWLAHYRVQMLIITCHGMCRAGPDGQLQESKGTELANWSL